MEINGHFRAAWHWVGALPLPWLAVPGHLVSKQSFHSGVARVAEPKTQLSQMGAERTDEKKGSLWTTDVALAAFHALVLSPPDVEGTLF